MSRRPRRGSGREPPAQLGGGQHQRGCGVRQQQGEPLLGKAGIERHVGPSRLEDGEEGRHQLRGAVEEDADRHLRPHAPRGAAGCASRLARRSSSP